MKPITVDELSEKAINAKNYQDWVFYNEQALSLAKWEADARNKYKHMENLPTPTPTKDDQAI